VFVAARPNSPSKRTRSSAISTLTASADVTVSSLPFGTQKRVELARALATEPKVLLLDEPAGGLNHEEVHMLGDLIRRIRDQRKVSVLLVEHHMGPGDVDRRPRRRASISAANSPMEHRPRYSPIRMSSPPIWGARNGTGDAQRQGSCGPITGACRHSMASTFLSTKEGVTTLLGANGAGKTTTLRAICNMVRSTGAIEFERRPALGRSTEAVVRARHRPCPARPRHVLHSLSVRENLQLGAITRNDRAGVASDVERSVQSLPGPQSAECPAGRYAFGRRAADARGRPRADAAPEADAAGTNPRSDWRR